MKGRLKEETQKEQDAVSDSPDAVSHHLTISVNQSADGDTRAAKEAQRAPTINPRVRVTAHEQRRDRCAAVWGIILLGLRYSI